jgi:hypothetical protein
MVKNSYSCFLINIWTKNNKFSCDNTSCICRTTQFNKICQISPQTGIEICEDTAVRFT